MLFMVYPHLFIDLCLQLEYMRGVRGTAASFIYFPLRGCMLGLIVPTTCDPVRVLGDQGLCSYLLIASGLKSLRQPGRMKAFMVTRVGDVLLLLGIGIVYRRLGG